MALVLLAPRQVEHLRNRLAVAEQGGVAGAVAVLARVELGQVGAGVLLLADEDGDRERRVRDREHRRGAPWALLREHEPEQVGARLGRDGHVLLAREPTHLHERAREQVMQLPLRVRRPHERRPDQHGIGPRKLCGGGLRARVDGALGDDDPVARRAGDERELGAPVDGEGAQVAGVQPDRVGAEPDGAVELAGVVRLDERVKADLLREGHERRGARVVQVAEDQQRGVGACLARGAQVVRRREEALGEQRQLRGGAGGAQVVPAAGEELVDKHRHGGGPASCVRRAHAAQDPRRR